MSRILITGATGFVGRAVSRTLRAEGHALSGTTRQADLGQGPEGVPLYHVADVSQYAEWRRVVSGADAVVHLAARTHVTRESGTQALDLYRATNVETSKNLALAAAEAGVKRFIFMSSVKAAGEETFGAPLRETDTPHPEDAYGISKWEAELALAEIAARSGLELVILRPPLVYGPFVRGNLLSLLKACARGWPLPLRNIDNRRSLISSANLASAVGLCVRDPRAAGGTFFVSDGQDISSCQLAHRLAAAMGRRAWLLPLPFASAARRLPGIGGKIRRLTGSLQIDSAAIRAVLGWTPPQTLDTGLGEMAAWYASTNPAPGAAPR